MSSVNVPATDEEWQNLGLEAGKVFTPTSPIDERSLFAGRDEQVRLIVDAIGQKGQHAALYGERGVGKTSLANVLSSFLGAPKGILAPRINCDSTDTFDTVWRKVFEQVELTRPVSVVGFGAQREVERVSLLDRLPAEKDSVGPEHIRRLLTTLSEIALPIVIVDEFDRLQAPARRAFADTIKSLSDHAVRATIVLVGVADSVEQLIEEHASVERALVQILMPRMSASELTRVLNTGASRLDMRFDDAAAARIVKLSQGLPHYTHLLGLYAARSAIDDRTMEITLDAVDAAVARAIGGTQQSVRSAYEKAVRSPKKGNLFADVLLSCAMADANELGFFAAQDVRVPLRKITGKPYDIPSFAQHLKEFCDDGRGPVLVKDGVRRKFRYRFVEPLLQPFVIMRGLSAGRIQPADL